MKKAIFFNALAVFLITACNNPAKESTTTPTTTTTTTTTTVPVKSEPTVAKPSTTTTSEGAWMLGTWNGEMGGKKLVVVIESIAGNKIVGYNDLAGNKRPIEGTFTEADFDQPCAKAYKAILNEPGDHKFDGVFSIQFVGFENSKETDNGPECLGKETLTGVEAMGEWRLNGSKTAKVLNLMKK